MNWTFAAEALLATIPIYIIILSGFALRRFGFLKKESDSSFVRLSIDVCIPCFIFYNMLGNDKLKSVGLSLSCMSAGAIGLAVALAVSYFFAKYLLKLKVGDGLRTFAVTTATQNYGFFVLSMLFLLYPKDNPYLGIALTHNVGCDLVFWSLCFLLLAKGVPFSIRLLLKGPVFAVFLALGIIWSGLNVYIPKFALNSLSMIGNASIPLNLIMFGCLLSDFWGFANINRKALSLAVLIRMFIMPAVFIAAAYILPIDHALKTVLVFEAVAPCGVTAAVLAKHFGGNPQMSVQITVATSLLALLVLPLWIVFGFKLLAL